jgi:fluoroquinolone resistance protein
MALSADFSEEVWRRLLRGAPLDGLPLGTRDGRLDLGGLFLPDALITRRFQSAKADVTQRETVQIKGAQWRSLDFTGGRLNGLLFSNSSLQNCVFDRCECQDWGLWATTVERCTFSAANLQRAVLGGLQDKRRNTFRDVTFFETNLSQTVYKSAEFIRCTFRDAKCRKIDFQGSTFVDCTFEGELNEVMFYRHAFRSESLPANEMVNVDFSRAKLRSVEFRGLNLDAVTFPVDDEHLVLNQYPDALDVLLDQLRRQSDVPSKQLVAYFSVMRKWVGPKQLRGVINWRDIADIAGKEGVARVESMLRG